MATLNGQKLNEMLSNPQRESVVAAIPKFDTEYSVEMSEVLKNMGMPLAFDEDNADFSGLGTSKNGNIFIDRVLHKTFISVFEKGTRAGAATVIEICDKAAAPGAQKVVRLDRPFVYMIIDCENNIPFFIGTMMDVKK
jgi:serpin B